jgi:BASS family bile acid:Na+ symporter
MGGLIGAWVVPASMFAVMFAMGLTLTADDFRRVVRLPVPTVVGAGLQLVAMPLAGLGLARGFALAPLLAAGLVIVAACPGGVMTNVLCHLGKADVALSITLTATATMITLVTIPLWVHAALANGGATAGAVDMPVLDTALGLAGFTVVPVLVGMAARHLRPRLVLGEPSITRAATLAMVIALGIEAMRREDPPVAALAATWQPALLLLLAALAMGLGVPLLLQLGWRTAATIGVEICIKNTVLGLFVATQSLRSLEAAVPILAFMTFQLPVGVVVLLVYALWRRRQPVAETAGAPSGEPT